MNSTIESLNKLHKRLLAEAEEQDGLGMAEVLAGNIVKENMQRGVAAGLRMAAALVAECATVDAMSARIMRNALEECLGELRPICEKYRRANGTYIATGVTSAMFAAEDALKNAQS